MNRLILKYLSFIQLFIILLGQNSFAQINLNKGSFFYPSQMQVKEYKQEISLLLAKLPEESIEEVSTLIYAPLFVYNAKYGLPSGFNLNGNISTNIITFQLRAGAQWKYKINNITISPYFDGAFWYGRLKNFGFNSTAQGWQSYPGIALGLEFEKFTLTAKGEFNFMLSMRQSADDMETSSDKNIVNGFLFSLMIEQPLWKDHFVTIGINLNYTKIYWPSWPVFSSWNRYLFIPEALIGFAL
jgi:hypothetical protein